MKLAVSQLLTIVYRIHEKQVEKLGSTVDVADRLLYNRFMVFVDTSYRDCDANSCVEKLCVSQSKLSDVVCKLVETTITDSMRCSLCRLMQKSDICSLKLTSKNQTCKYRYCKNK